MFNSVQSTIGNQNSQHEQIASIKQWNSFYFADSLEKSLQNKVTSAADNHGFPPT
ncbi:hypothetical protein [Legionella lansingensis]|uniref:hypothetical protein n=1 Tax=Legionella lansingensis TaxID=45067 RepID=UPI000ABCA671|nr:hypothetical protein [Legionella lansingensis]